MSVTSFGLKWIAFGLLVSSAWISVFFAVRAPQSLPNRSARRYLGHLDRTLRNMFMALSGQRIVLAQVFGLALAILCCIYAPSAYVLGVFLIAIFGPVAWLEFLQRRRIKRIESLLPGFLLVLANNLRATPSIGNALAYSLPLAPAPLDQELALALKEIRLGSTVDQALMSLVGRIKSVQVNTAMSSVLIGRQVGGDLIGILETTSKSLREMARLEGFLRSKTAESKSQLALLAGFPAVLLFAFNIISPGYFDILGESFVGWVIVTTAVVLWLASLVVARKILAVDL